VSVPILDSIIVKQEKEIEIVEERNREGEMAEIENAAKIPSNIEISEIRVEASSDVPIEKYGFVFYYFCFIPSFCMNYGLSTSIYLSTISFPYIYE
jgi:hypothetical protein